MNEEMQPDEIRSAIQALEDIQDQLAAILPVMAKAMAEALDVIDPIIKTFT